MRSGREHCRPALAVEVWQGTLAVEVRQLRSGREPSQLRPGEEHCHSDTREANKKFLLTGGETSWWKCGFTLQGKENHLWESAGGVVGLFEKNAQKFPQWSAKTLVPKMIRKKIGAKNVTVFYGEHSLQQRKFCSREKCLQPLHKTLPCKTQARQQQGVHEINAF